MDVWTALEELGGAARRDALLALGVSPSAVYAAVDSGSVVRPVRGTYALPQTPREMVVAAAVRGQIVCRTAAAYWGLRQLAEPTDVHVGVPRARHLKPDRLRALGGPTVHRADLRVQGGLVASVLDAIDQSAHCTTPLEQLVMVDGALNAGQLSMADLTQLTCGTVRRRRWLVSQARVDADSAPETVARAVLNAAGLGPTAQVSRTGVGRVDFQVGPRHVIEIDGYAYHSSKQAFIEDRRRDRVIARDRGWTLRFTYWDVVASPRSFAREVADIVGVRVDRRFDSRYAWMTARRA